MDSSEFCGGDTAQPWLAAGGSELSEGLLDEGRGAFWLGDEGGV
jgi:hypothetical protein